MFECLVSIFVSVSSYESVSSKIVSICLVMEKDESDGYFRATVDLADGIFHYQFKSMKMFFSIVSTKFSRSVYFVILVQTKSWFEKEPEPALPNYDDDEYKEMSM